MATNTLANTWFEPIYLLTPNKTDHEVLIILSLITGIIAPLGLIFSTYLGLPFQFGKGKDVSGLRNGVVKSVFAFCPIPATIAWKIAFIPYNIVPFLVLFFTPSSNIWFPKNAIAFGIMVTHHLYRTFIYTSWMTGKSTPIGIVFTSALFFVHGPLSFLQVHNLCNVLQPEGLSLPVMAGGIIAVIGALINVYHDGVLTGIKGKGKGYQIPQGGLFAYVSCPNYFGELVKWWGLTLVTGSIPMLSFTIFSCVMLGLKAIEAETFYHKKFGAKYPKERKTLVPFIY